MNKKAFSDGIKLLGAVVLIFLIVGVILYITTKGTGQAGKVQQYYTSCKGVTGTGECKAECDSTISEIAYPSDECPPKGNASLADLKLCCVSPNVKT